MDYGLPDFVLKQLVNTGFDKNMTGRLINSDGFKKQLLCISNS